MAPEQIREYNKLKMRKHRAKPGVREKERAKRATLEARAKRLEYERAYAKRPGVAERLKANAKRWAEKPESKEYHRKKAAAKRFAALGMPHPSKVEEMRISRGVESCEICHRKSWRKASNGVYQITALSVDHDHQTGRIRGFLCAPCNLILGNAEDNPQRLIQAAQYLLNEIERTYLDVAAERVA